MTTSRYQNPPDAATIAARHDGARAGANDWRLPGICHGHTDRGDNPALSVKDRPGGGLLIYCHICQDDTQPVAWYLAQWGYEDTPIAPPAAVAYVGLQPGATARLLCPRCETEGLQASRIDGTCYYRLRCDCGAPYTALMPALPEQVLWAEYLLADGKPRRMVRQHPSRPGGRKTTWAKEVGPDGQAVHRRARGLVPLKWGEDDGSATLVITPGEKAAAAMLSAPGLAGYIPVSTTADAGMANADYAGFSGRNAIIWPDADDDTVNPKTGKPIKKSPYYARIAAARLVALGAASVWFVDLASVQAAIPPGGKVDGADAADVPPAQIVELLASAPDWTPDQNTEPVDASSGKAYPWYHPGDFLPPWDCTPDADCMRTMRRHAADLLVVTPDVGSRSYLRAASGGGVWARSDDDIDQLIADTALEWARDALGDKSVDRNTAAQVVRWQKRLSGTTGRNAAQESVGRVRGRWADDKTLPPALTLCRESEIDADRRYLGAPNGVIDLDTGDLITGAAASALLVSRSVPDPYDPTAQHSVIDALLAHLGDDERQYLLSALGFALRGNPARRFYLLAGERNGGKTTVLAAAKACVGDVKAGGYGMTIQPAVLLTDRMQHANGHHGGLFGVQDAKIATVSEIPDGRGRFNVGLLKALTGGDPESHRDVGEKAGPSRPATATIFIAANPPDFDRLDLTDSALEDRARILPYPSLPGGQRNPAVLDTVQHDPKARQAMLVVLVRAATTFAGDPFPPADIPSVIEAVEDRRQASIGEVGQWLRDNLMVTGRRDHLLATDELIEALAFDHPADDKGRYAGQTRKNVLAMAREVVQGMPAAKVSSIGGKKRRYYRGVRLATAEELQAHFEQLGDDRGADRCAECGKDNGGNPLVDGKWCMKCKLDMDETRRVKMRRTGSVSPAIERIADDGVAVLDADDVDPERAAEAQKVITEYLRQRAGQDVLTKNLGRAAQAVSEGVMLGAKSPDQLVNRAFPQYRKALKAFVAESGAGQQEGAGDGDDAE